jgi:hypothetical protein
VRRVAPSSLRPLQIFAACHSRQAEEFEGSLERGGKLLACAVLAADFMVQAWAAEGCLHHRRDLMCFCVVTETNKSQSYLMRRMGGLDPV